MLEITQQSRSPVQIDPATHAECLGFVRDAIATADRQTALDIKNVLAEVCQRGHADRNAIWAALSDTEQQQFKELLLPAAHHFAKRIKQAIGWNSPGVALGIDCDLEDAIDRGEVVAADVVEVVGDRHFLDFQELVARCPKYFTEIPAPSIEATTKKLANFGVP
ncbi:hypothetical protein [Microcoleus sp. B13-B6]|uniref:hypothetical protein n=1 Tax=unclassified Microcoleus TaxID=2642155 RepID=UPI002FCE8BDF